MTIKAQTPEGALYTGRRPADEDEICTCGRPAIAGIGNEWGGCGWCGTSNLPALVDEAEERRRVEKSPAKRGSRKDRRVILSHLGGVRD